MLFDQRAPYPVQGGWPDIEADLDKRLFPGALLSEDRLRVALAPERIEALREMLHHELLCAAGHMSHQIDLTAHGTARQWNGFRTLPEPVWRIIRGRRDYLIDRG